jgi:hypothetical protein
VIRAPTLDCANVIVTVMAKTKIIERLGETAVLVPGLIAEALAANDRLKLRLSLLQEAAGQAAKPERQLRSFDAERRSAGLDDPALDAVIKGARLVGPGRVSAPGAGLLVAGIGPDLLAMSVPLEAAGTAGWEALKQRLSALLATVPAANNDELAISEIGALTSARRGSSDSIHLLIMDLHKAINRLAAETAVEEIDGAKAHHLSDWDRARVRAFMKGLNRTAPLAFGHPGLGTLAARAGSGLTIQNDIGETDAHVLVVHVEHLGVTVTYTDVHRRRAKFFMALFGERVEWSALAEQAAKGMGDDEMFFLVTGRFEGADEAALDGLLGFLGSRIVFLIDWNKARKALQTFIGRDPVIELLRWAADQDLGHRAFLELGGADLVLEAVRRAATGRVPYGVRLDGALGVAETTGFLRRILRETSEGLSAGRSARLIRDEIQADLAQRFETAQSVVLAILVRHLGLSRTLAAAAADWLAPGRADDPVALAALVDRSKRLEAKADRLTVEAREICGRLHDSGAMRRLVDEVENAMDALDECVFLMSLTSPAAPRTSAELGRLAEIVVECLGQMVRATEAAAMLPEGQRADAVAALQAIDATVQAERDADAAERSSISALMRSDGDGARALVLGLEIARALETTTDFVAHAALALREQVLEELSA